MVHTATTPSNLYNFHNFDFKVSEKSYINATSKASNISGLAEPDTKLITWLNGSKIVTTLNYRLISAGKLFQHDRLVLKFGLTEQYTGNFVLLRGLIEFSRPKEISITSDRINKSFELELNTSETQIIQEYLEKIFKWLLKEIKFKAVLKEVIELQNRVRAEQDILYSKMKAVLS